MIVGPPGSGKTDVAVQIICNLYRSYPSQKILVVAHSNAALNDIFEKIRYRETVNPRHMLRLGSGSEDLFSGTEDFSRAGRVNHSLARRIELLEQVQTLGRILGVIGDVGSSCETAEYFFLEQIKPKIETFKSLVGVDNSSKISCTKDVFPFTAYFDAVEPNLSPLFTGNEVQDIKIAYRYLEYVNELFVELREYRAFELLRSMGQRGDYILTKQVMNRT